MLYILIGWVKIQTFWVIYSVISLIALEMYFLWMAYDDAAMLLNLKHAPANKTFTPLQSALVHHKYLYVLGNS